MLNELGIKGLRVDVSSVCNLNCKYCYIAKSKVLPKLQKEVFDSLEKVEKWLKESRSLTIWGAEPAFGLIKIANIIEKGGHRFGQIYLSTNMTVSPKIYIQALKKFVGRTKTVRIQVSLDGYKELHERNRGEGSWEKIVGNTKEFVKMLNNVKVDYTVELRFNSVMDADTIEWFAEDLERLDKWYRFYESFTKELRELSTNPKVRIGMPISPNLAVPGKYTKQDGINFAKVVKGIINNGYTFGQFYRFLEYLKDPLQLVKKVNVGNTSCGAVFGGLGWDRGTFHPCHRTYWLQDDEYVEDVIKNYGDWWTSRADYATINNIRRHIARDDDEYRIKRMVYTIGATQVYPQLNISYAYAMIKMLAKIGQINRIYLENDTLAKLLALYIPVGIKCLSENLVVTGSVHVTPTSYFKLFGNGAFETLVEHHKKEVLDKWM